MLGSQKLMKRFFEFTKSKYFLLSQSWYMHAYTFLDIYFFTISLFKAVNKIFTLLLQITDLTKNLSQYGNKNLKKRKSKF